MKNPWIIIGVIAVVLISGSVWYSSTLEEKNNVGVDTSITHMKGNLNSEVTLVEYSDFQCPACASFEPVLEQLFEEHGDKFRFEYRHFPLMGIHPLAEPAARASEAAAQQGKFFEYHDLLFANQNSWTKSANPTALFVKYAEELDLDVDQFERHMKSSLISDRVKASFEEARELGLTGTPTFFLNGEEMQFETFAEFTQQVEDAIGVRATTSEQTES